jgi:hypothetical protein
LGYLIEPSLDSFHLSIWGSFLDIRYFSPRPFLYLGLAAALAELLHVGSWPVRSGLGVSEFRKFPPSPLSPFSLFLTSFFWPKSGLWLDFFQFDIDMRNGYTEIQT